MKIISQTISEICQFFEIQHGGGSHIGFLTELFILHIYDTMLDVFLGVENIGVESKIKSLCW